MMDKAVRYAQWRYWTQGQDLVKELAHTVG